MRECLLNLIVCPCCGRKLYLEDSVYNGDEIVNGSLICSGCEKIYPVLNGVPRLLESSEKIRDTAKGFGELFRLRKRGKFEKETLYGGSEEKEFRDFFKKLLIQESDLKNKVILDAGCGVGRLTKNLGEFECEVVGIDIHDSIEIAHMECINYPNVHIIQADLFNLPFPKQTFDYVWCEGVLPYTYKPRIGFSVLASVLRAGGRIYIWVYPKKGGSTFMLRRIFRNSYHYPTPLLYFIVNVLALIYTGVKFSMGWQDNPKELYKQKAFSYYDTLSQKYMQQFDIDEIIGWFNEEEFADIIETEKNGIGITGAKK